MNNLYYIYIIINVFKNSGIAITIKKKIKYIPIQKKRKEKKR